MDSFTIAFGSLTIGIFLGAWLWDTATRAGNRKRVALAQKELLRLPVPPTYPGKTARHLQEILDKAQYDGEGKI